MEGQRNTTETQENPAQETPRNAGAAAEKVHKLRTTRLPVTPAMGDEPDTTNTTITRNNDKPKRSTTGVRVDEDGNVTRTTPLRPRTTVRVDEDGNVTRTSPKKTPPDVKIDEEGNATRRSPEKPKPVVSVGRSNEQTSEDSDRPSSTPQNTQAPRQGSTDQPPSSPTPRNGVKAIGGDGLPKQERPETLEGAPQTQSNTTPEEPTAQESGLNNVNRNPPVAPRTKVKIEADGTVTRTPAGQRTEQPASSPTPRNGVKAIGGDGLPKQERPETLEGAPQTQSNTTPEEPTAQESGFKGVSRPPQPAARVIPRVGMDGRRLN